MKDAVWLYNLLWFPGDNVDDSAFTWIEIHLPGFFPMLKGNQVFLKLVWFVTLRNNRQLSANSLVELVLITSGRSFINVKNSRGPRTMPCGTPETTSTSEESMPSSSTCFLRWLKNAAIQPRCCCVLHSMTVYEEGGHEASYRNPSKNLTESHLPVSQS